LDKINLGIVVFSFGQPGNIRSNVYLAKAAVAEARWIMTMSERITTEIFTQKDILIKDKDVMVEYIEQNDSPPPTLRIARAAVRWAKREGFRHLWVIAAKPHMWRCMRDVNYAVKEADVGESLAIHPVNPSISADEWFCPESTQKRTRSREAWEKRERILRHMPMCLYKLIAS